MRTLALMVMLGLTACGGSADETDTDVGTELGTEADSDTSADSEVDTEADSDSEASSTAFCDACDASAAQTRTACDQSCSATADNPCDRDACQNNCSIDFYDETRDCMVDEPACDAIYDARSCVQGCHAAQAMCLTSDNCGTENWGLCEEEFSACMGRC